MKLRRMGKTNLRVSPLCLGTMMFGDQTDARAAADIVASARAHGVNFVDTADVYSLGECERVLGPLLRPDRDRWVLASKIGNKMSDAPNEGHYSRKWIMQELEASLRRLQTDYLDIYYLHRDFEHDDLEEPLRAMDDLIRAGKIRYFGLSNFRGWRIAEVVRLCERMGIAAPAICQPYYNLLNRMPEVEILPACQYHGIGVAPYSPIARGVLTGKYTPGVAPEAGTRAGRADKRITETELRQESLVIAQKLGVHVQARGITLAQFATAWVLANPIISSVIAGPRTLAQWQDYFPAVDYVVTPEDEALVDGFVGPGHPSTPGYTDPAYPLIGRPTRP